MDFFAKLFKNSDSEVFIDLETTFKLSSKESSLFKGAFECKLIKTVTHNGTKGYLVELEQTFSGVDFGVGAVAIKRFFLIPKYYGKFGNKAENEVLITLPKDLKSETQWDENNILAWGYVHDIKT